MSKQEAQISLNRMTRCGSWHLTSCSTAVLKLHFNGLRQVRGH